MLERRINIAVDGPCGAGKGTICSALASLLEYKHFDAGASYRALALFFHEKGISYKDFDPEVLKDVEIEYLNNGDGIRVNDRRYVDEIRTAEIGKLSAKFANQANGFKPFILDFQSKMVAEEDGIIGDGRDMAVRVMPNADLKIYFTADAKIRAQRRFLQLQTTHRSENHDFDKILASMLARDQEDYDNEKAPLMRPEDALRKSSPYDYVIDSTNLTPEGQVELAMKYVRGKMAELKEQSRETTV